MQTQQTRTNAPRPRVHGAECCGDANCETGLRNNYYEHKKLSIESFRAEQAYSLERRRLLNRAIHGWGVVNGYAITVAAPDPYGKGAPTGSLKIGPGLALDSCGRELLEVGRTIALADVLALENGKRIDPFRSPSELQQSGRYAHSTINPEECWLLCAHYAEQSISPVSVQGACECQRREWDYTCETVRYSVQRISCKECCRSADCELECECQRGGCCRDLADSESLRRPKDLRSQRGGCRCICDYITGLEFECCGPLCPIDEPCGQKVRVDLGHCVPLACIDIVLDRCDQWAFGERLEVCGPRRLVKRNDLLFDLIRGCDLTRIGRISWEDWHRKQEAVSFEEFSDFFGPFAEDQDECVTSFSVEFSRPVLKETLHSDCFAITVMSAEREGGWRETLRVPIVRIDTERFQKPGDPKGYVWGGTIVVEGAWLEDAVRGRKNRFLGAEAWVEIEVRGDFILDCNGQAVDANAVGLHPYPSGNGTPGGTFLSTFRVASEPEPHHHKGANL
jgi:hypothetical protein